MDTALRVGFRHMKSSAAVSSRVKKEVEKLEQIFNHIVSCSVTIDAHHDAEGDPTHFDIGIDLNIPGHEIAVHSKRGPNAVHNDVYVAMREAFDAAAIKLRHEADRLRGHVKKHGIREDLPLAAD